jgi:hypothetical protein
LGGSYPEKSKWRPDLSNIDCASPAPSDGNACRMLHAAVIIIMNNINVNIRIHISAVTYIATITVEGAPQRCSTAHHLRSHNTLTQLLRAHNSSAGWLLAGRYQICILLQHVVVSRPPAGKQLPARCWPPSNKRLSLPMPAAAGGWLRLAGSASSSYESPSAGTLVHDHSST